MRAEDKKKISARMNRIAGQVAGVQRMIEENRYCMDILGQIAAVRSALDGLGIELLTKHLEHCVLNHGGADAHPQSQPLAKEQLLAEVQTALARFLK